VQDATCETYELPPLSDAPPTGMFGSLEQPLDSVREWNTMRRWGFTAAELDAIDLTPPKHVSPLAWT